MDTYVEYNGIELRLEMNEPPRLVHSEQFGSGWAHPANLVNPMSQSDIEKLIGLKLWGETVVAVDSDKIKNIRYIALFLKNKLW